MTTTQSIGSANVMTELYFESLRRLGLLDSLNAVPFAIQSRRTGFSSAARCLSFLASQAQKCQNLTDWTNSMRQDSRLEHWLGGRTAPHPSTLSRTLASANADTVKALRGVLVALSNQALLQATDRQLFLDVDSKGMPAEGRTYESTATGRMGDGTFARGYRLHLLSLDNRWPLEMQFTGAQAHGAAEAMVMVKSLMHRLPAGRRKRIVIRGDSNYGAVRFIRFLQRYRCRYLLKGYNTSTARRLWNQTDAKPVRIPRENKADLLAVNLGATVLTGMSRKKTPDGQSRRRAQKVCVPRVVVYHVDPDQASGQKEPEVFCLITSLNARAYSPVKLLDCYNRRAGDVENIFCQLDQAFSITHLRSRRFWGNFAFLMLTMIAANLTQWIREQAAQDDLPVPAGLSETLAAASDSGLRLIQDLQAGCTLVRTHTSLYTETFERALRCCHQLCFLFAA